MNNEVGDKSPNEAATEWLIVGETLALVPLRSICRGGYHVRKNAICRGGSPCPPDRRKKNGEAAAVFDRRMKFAQCANEVASL